MNVPNEIENILNKNILPFWEKSLDTKHGGFVGKIDKDGRIDPKAPKGLIQHSRLLWTFSRTYQKYPTKLNMDLANTAYSFLKDAFYNTETKGWAYMVNHKGYVLDDHNHVYALSFVIYGLTQYYLAFLDDHALKMAQDTFKLIEKYAKDYRHSGYHENLDGDLKKIDQKKEFGVEGSQKTMNTHIHLLESYTLLYQATQDQSVLRSLEFLMDLIFEKILNKRSYSLELYFEADWTLIKSPISYGHDIETSWLLTKASTTANYKLEHFKDVSLHMAYKVLRKGIDPFRGGLFYEGDREQDVAIDGTKVWWAQAEALSGFMNAYQLSQDDVFLEAFNNIYTWINKYQIDHQNMEWYDKVYLDGSTGQEKASLWKTPYHNARACLMLLDWLTPPSKLKH